MDALFFSLKRVFHKSNAIALAIARPFGLTASRFDMLYAIRERGWRVLQRDLRAILGVTAATISRMLDALVALGLVTRRPYGADRRTNEIELTAHGERSIDIATYEILGGGVAELAAQSIVSPVFMPEDVSRLYIQMVAHLECMQGTLGDRSTLRYEWDHPEDWDGPDSHP